MSTINTVSDSMQKILTTSQETKLVDEISNPPNADDLSTLVKSQHEEIEKLKRALYSVSQLSKKAQIATRLERERVANLMNAAQ